MNPKTHLSLEWRTYRRPFVKPLRTSHGFWREREGLIVRLTDRSGNMGYGECAPIASFGTETFSEGRAWLEQSGGVYQPGAPANRELDALPSLAYALASAEQMLANATGAEGIAYGEEGATATHYRWPVCALLPAGVAALEHFSDVLEAGYSTFKWKIGVAGIKEEMRIALSLLAEMPSCARLRLDANGSLGDEVAVRWCEFLAQEAQGRCAYLEQPLLPGREMQMAELYAKYDVPIALDESFAQRRQGGVQALAAQMRDWDGFCVLKPSLIGSGKVVASVLLKKVHRTVFSSAFETDVGVDALLALAATVGEALPAMGLDTVAAFDDGMNTDLARPWIVFNPALRLVRAQAVWESLSR
jgi:O-succinylbenzoate synthase